MPEPLGLLLLVACSALAAAQAWFLPFGPEREEPRARRTALAVALIVILVLAITAAHALLPAHPTLAAVLGAIAGVLTMKALRASLAPQRR